MTWYDLIPVFGAVVTIAGISFKAGQILQKLDHKTEDIKEMEIRNKYFEYLYQTSAVSSTVSWTASNPKFCSKVTSISGNIST